MVNRVHEALCLYVPPVLNSICVLAPALRAASPTPHSVLVHGGRRHPHLRSCLLHLRPRAPPRPASSPQIFLILIREHTGADQSVGGQVREGAAGGARRGHPESHHEGAGDASYIRSANTRSPRGRLFGRPRSPTASKGSVAEFWCIPGYSWERNTWRRLVRW